VDLKARLAGELQQAMKARENVRVSTLRMAISAIRNKEIERKKDLAEGEILEVIQAEAKSRRESIEQYKNAGRADLADKEDAELKVLLAYLPEPMSESQLRELVQKTLQTVGAKGPQDMGKVMSALMPQIKGRIDGKQAQQVVQQLLKS
jgi:uncharacterized protein